MQTFRADLHVHTVLSPCAEIEMLPPLIVQEAIEHQIDLIAITDHNASANVAAVQKAAQGSGLVVLPGMEIQSREEVHILCLFEHLEQLNKWQAQVDAALPDMTNQPEFFGEQLVVDEEGEFIRTEPRLLLTSTSFSIDNIYEQVNRLGGLVIPAHVERTSNGLFPTLGLVSPQWPVEAFEISRRITPEKARKKFPAIGNYPLIQSGDVHMLESFLGSTIFTIETRTLAEIKLALHGREGRSVKIQPPTA